MPSACPYCREQPQERREEVRSALADQKTWVTDLEKEGKLGHQKS